jgi:hypothetical protein
MARRFALHVPVGESMKLVIDQRQQLVARDFVTLAPRGEQLRYLGWWIVVFFP